VLRRAWHRVLAWACRLMLAASYPYAALFCPPLGDWLERRMRHHEEEASR
jgi:hypothetical protein